VSRCAETKYGQPAESQGDGGCSHYLFKGGAPGNRRNPHTPSLRAPTRPINVQRRLSLLSDSGSIDGNLGPRVTSPGRFYSPLCRGSDRVGSSTPVPELGPVERPIRSFPVYSSPPLFSKMPGQPSNRLQRLPQTSPNGMRPTRGKLMGRTEFDCW
jgi:hypothetical protein